MARDRTDVRSRADQQFEKAQRTTVAAKTNIETERDATRKKTKQLKELRLAKEADAGITDRDKKPVRQKGKTKRKP